MSEYYHALERQDAIARRKEYLLDPQADPLRRLFELWFPKTPHEQEEAGLLLSAEDDDDIAGVLIARIAPERFRELLLRAQCDPETITEMETVAARAREGDIEMLHELSAALYELVWSHEEEDLDRDWNASMGRDALFPHLGVLDAVRDGTTLPAHRLH